MTERVRRGRGPLFAQVPEELLFDPAISPNAKTAYGILHRYVDNRPESDTEGTAFPGREGIAEKMGRSVDTVDRALKELETADWIDVERPAGGLRNLYTVHLVRTDAHQAEQELVRTGAHQRSARVRSSRSARVRSTSKENKENQNKGTKTASASPPSAPRKPPAEPKVLDPLTQCADDIARHVWENRNPRPAANFMGTRGVFKKLLAAGWLPEQVQAAGMAVPALTVHAMEFELNRAADPARGHGAERLTAAEQRRLRGDAATRQVIATVAAMKGEADPYAPEPPTPTDPFLALGALDVKELTA